MVADSPAKSRLGGIPIVGYLLPQRAHRGIGAPTRSIEVEPECVFELTGESLAMPSNYAMPGCPLLSVFALPPRRRTALLPATPLPAFRTPKGLSVTVRLAQKLAVFLRFFALLRHPLQQCSIGDKLLLYQDFQA